MSAFLNFEPVKSGDTIVTIRTNRGDIKVKMLPEAAPKAVENFVTHAKNGYYDGIIFHRVIRDFMIQGGDPTDAEASAENEAQINNNRPKEDVVINSVTLDTFRAADYTELDNTPTEDELAELKRRSAEEEAAKEAALNGESAPAQ